MKNYTELITEALEEGKEMSYEDFKMNFIKKEGCKKEDLDETKCKKAFETYKEGYKK